MKRPKIIEIVCDGFNETLNGENLLKSKITWGILFFLFTFGSLSILLEIGIIKNGRESVPISEAISAIRMFGESFPLSAKVITSSVALLGLWGLVYRSIQTGRQIKLAEMQIEESKKKNVTDTFLALRKLFLETLDYEEKKIKHTYDNIYTKHSIDFSYNGIELYNRIYPKSNPVSGQDKTPNVSELHCMMFINGLEKYWKPFFTSGKGNLLTDREILQMWKELSAMFQLLHAHLGFHAALPKHIFTVEDKDITLIFKDYIEINLLVQFFIAYYKPILRHLGEDGILVKMNECKTAIMVAHDIKPLEGKLTGKRLT